MECDCEDVGFLPAELKLETKRLVCRIIEESGAELISPVPHSLKQATKDSARSSPVASDVAGDVSNVPTDETQSAACPRSAAQSVGSDRVDAGRPDPDTTIYMEDPEEEGHCVGVRLWGFSELLVRQVTQLILDSRKYESDPQEDAGAARDYHVELLYKFVEQVVKNLLENITHLPPTPPTTVAELRKESLDKLCPVEIVVNAPLTLPAREDALSKTSSDKLQGTATSSNSVPCSIPTQSLSINAPSYKTAESLFTSESSQTTEVTSSVTQKAVAQDQTEVVKAEPKCEKESSRSPFRQIKMCKNSVVPWIHKDSLDGAMSARAVKKPKDPCFPCMTAILSKLFCFGCNVAVHQQEETNHLHD